MATRLTHIVVDSGQNFAPIARFWSQLLDWPITFDEEDEIYVEGEDFGVVFGPVPEPKTVKNRVHVDLASDSVDQQREIVAKALALGARRIDIGQGDDVPWVVLADPDGNEFCVVETIPEGLDVGAIICVTMDCADPSAIAPLWAVATGMEIARQDENFAGLRPVKGRGPWLALVRVPEAKTIKNRV